MSRWACLGVLNGTIVASVVCLCAPAFAQQTKPKPSTTTSSQSSAPTSTTPLVGQLLRVFRNVRALSGHSVLRSLIRAAV